jgi:serine phosphatase RsbU (regulator of sigma subunit)/ligand-binding sensor domain-containing protein
MDCYQKKIMRCFVFLACLILHLASYRVSFAQSYQLISYQTDQGLPNNIVKGIVQDGTGFIWIATDGGISRYDGKNFLNYKKELPSNYTKGFMRTRAGKILCLNDGGLTEVHSKYDGATFSSFIAGGQDLKDAKKVIYPKDALEDCQGNVWVAESQSILKWSKGQTKRYTFEEKYLKNDFSRSFRIVEAACGHLFITTYAGFLFKYNDTEDKFDLIDIGERIYDVADAIAIERSTIWLGESSGVTEVKFSPDYKKHTTKRVIKESAVSALHIDKKGNVFMGTWRKGVFRIDYAQENPTARKIVESKANVINYIFVDAEGNLWLCTNDGLEFLQPNAFKTVVVGDYNVYVQSISYKAGQALVLSEGSKIHQVLFQNNDYETKVLYDHKANVFGLAQTKGKYYIGTNDAELVIWQRDKVKTIDLRKYGATVNQVYADKKDNVWISQYDRKNGVVKVDAEDNLTHYSNAEGLESPIYAVAEAPDGTLYAVGEGSAFLYRFNPSKNKFENISQPVITQSNITLRARDLYVEDDHTIWIGTNLGLFVQRNGKLSLVNLGKRFTNADVSAIAKDKEGNFWIGSELGLIKYKGDKVVVFEKVNGLSNVNISHRGILCTDNGRIFVATTNGFNFSVQKLGSTEHTPAPVFLNMKSNDQHIDWEKQKVFEGGITFQVDFVSFTYPNQPVLYQYRLKGITEGEEWIDLGTQNQIVQPRMPAGSYVLEIRARQQGNHDWSKPITFSFQINKLWYLTNLAIFSYIVLGAVLIWLGVNIYTFRLKQQKQVLSKRIALATKEIEERAQHLQEANTLLSSQKEEIQRQKKSLEEQKDLLEETYQIIQLKNNKITDSIRYARTIQSAVLPEERALNNAFRDHFVIYRPKDVVSGDFYWMLPYQNRHFVAVVDCTGHGVPGAFMSMIGHTLLYRIIKLKGILEPAAILATLHNEVRVVLRQRYTGNVDGMDICLCVLEKMDSQNDYSPYKITFSGAKLPLYYVTNDSLELLEEDRKAIGGIQNQARNFTNKEVILQAGDMIYLRSDGITDQNNFKRKKFGETQFSKIIEKNAHLPMKEQKNILEEALDNYQEGTEQRDDITVLGIKL